MTKKPTSKDQHTHEFSRRARSYTQHNIIQQKVVMELISGISSKPRSILDLGCGSGAVYDLLDWDIERFVGIDKAEQMCALHPQNQKITLLHEDFEDASVLQSLGHFDLVISSSAMQWAKDIQSMFANIAGITDEIAFAVFGDGTFQKIYDITKIKSFLPSYDMLLEKLEKEFIFTYEVKKYKLFFEDNLSKFRYIKNSGVSGGNRQLSYQETKKLIREYPLEYLEFEVLFVWGKVHHH